MARGRAAPPGLSSPVAVVEPPPMLRSCPRHLSIASSSGRPATSARARSQAIAANPALELVGCYALVAGQGRPRRRRAVRHRPAGCSRHQRHRRAARAEARLRRLQPDVAGRRRAGAHPVGRRERRRHGRLHHRPQPRRRSRSDPRGVRAGWLDDVRLRHQPWLRRAAGRRGLGASAIGSTRSPSTRRPTPRSTTRPTRSGRLGFGVPIDIPTCRA